MPVKILEASGAVSARRITVYALNVQGGDEAMTVELANQATAGGTEVLGWGAAAGALSEGPEIGPCGEIFNTACYATITGAGAKIWVHFKNTPGGNVQ